MTHSNHELGVPNLFSATVDGDPLVLRVRLERNRFASDDEMTQLKASLDRVVSQQLPHVIAFNLGKFNWYSEEVVELLLRYRREVERIELHNPPQYFVEKLAQLNLAQLFAISTSDVGN